MKIVKRWNLYEQKGGIYMSAIEQYNDTVEYRGFCKIKNHNSACFFINKVKQAYYCFGCKQGGGIIQFVMRMKDYSFCETLEYLEKYVIWKENEIKKVA